MSLHLPDLIRELHYFWGGSATLDCSGLGFGTIALVGLISWVLGFFTGGLLAILIFSITAEKVLLFLLQGGAQLLAPTVSGEISSRALELRTRLRQYRAGD